ncbi:MAG: ABC transporter substrate-binding protein [Desulfatiglans sp.]|jgi:microcin C transport system substrate-binding protein|nr:ABC transporter substrate-binding protein [Desulfatiglans sp.]
MLRKIIFIVLLLVFFTSGVLLAKDITTSHGITLYGDLMYGKDFKHFNYVNPKAPKGGTIVWDMGNFDNINSYIALGTSPGFATFSVFENLMVTNADEPNSAYGLIAETVTYPEDYKWAEFKIRDIARWNDGKPITVEDVIYSYETMRDKASPTYKSLVADIEKVEKTGKDTVKFIFLKPGDRNNVYKIATRLPVIPKHYWINRDFSQPTIEMNVQSTPYVFYKVDVGNTLIMKRDENYWGKDLPVNAGRNNFDFVRMDVYRDTNVAYEAFMGGNIDIRNEFKPAQWKKGYNNDAVKKSFIKKREDKLNGPVWFFAIGMNGRRPQFKDQKTREALAYAFDWEWTNKNIFHGMYERNTSYFANTELAHRGVPEGKELALLEPYRDKLDPRVFTQEFVPPSTQGTQEGLRNNLRKASKLLKEAGWENIEGKLVRDGKPFMIDFMLQDPSDEPLFAPFVENLKLLGIDARLDIVDSTTFWPRNFSYDWDMISNGLYPHSLSPGAELKQNWGSKTADANASSNSQYIKNSIVDDLIEQVVNAKTRDDKVAACRALDRVLLWNYYSINMYFWNKQLMAYWDRFGIPETQPKWEAYSPSDTWWVDPVKDAAVKKYRGLK